MSKYIIDKNKLMDLATAYKSYAKVYYPVKVNSSFEVIGILDSCVDGYEVDSIELLEYLINDCKISPSRVLYSSLISSKSDYEYVLRLGVRFFVIDDIEQFNLLCSITEISELDFLVRISVSDLVECDGLVLKWGCNLETIPVFFERISGEKSHLKGFSFYLPQEINNSQNVLCIVDCVCSLVKKYSCNVINIGGGMCVELVSIVFERIKNNFEYSMKEIIVEPGRCLLEQCIDLVCEIKAVKKFNSTKMVFIDSGIYNGLLDCVIKHKKFGVEMFENSCSSEKTEMYLVCGETSDVSDTLGLYELPQGLEAGSQLIIHNVGAYCYELETHFYRKRRNMHYIQ